MIFPVTIRWVISIVLVVGLLPMVAAAEETKGWASIAREAASSATGGVQSLQRLFGGDGQPELLPPEQAFTVNVKVRDANSLIAEFQPAQGYYLYRDRITFSIDPASGMQVAGVELPKGENKQDPTFGYVEVFHYPFTAIVSMKRTAEAATSGRLRFNYQGCSDSGVCYPPIDRTFDFVLPATVAAASIGAVTPDMTGRVPDGAAITAARSPLGWLDLDRSAALFEAGSSTWVVAGFFVFGLLLSLTPCVWPMFPILSGIIAGQGSSLGKNRAFCLSASYVLGMAITYAIMGVAAGLSGSMLATALQTPWALAAMAALFVVLALSMFGLYELQLPAWLQSRLTGNASGRRSAAGIFGMGAVSALIVGPCIAAPLAGALLYIGQTRDVVLGAAALFAMALGKGVPLLVIGTSLGTLLPRSGPWMQSVKNLLGVLLLAGAVWILSPYLPGPVTMAAAGVILIVYGVYLRAIDPLPPEAQGFTRVGRGAGLIALLVGAIYLVGAFSGSRDFLQPLAGLHGSAQQEIQASIQFERVKSVEEFDARLQNAAGRYVMLDFYADWCVSCKEMEHFTFTDPSVKAKLRDVTLLQADVTANSADDKRLLARFGLFGPPGILFFDKSGQEIKGRRVIGFMNAEKFSRVLTDVFR